MFILSCVLLSWVSSSVAQAQEPRAIPGEYLVKFRQQTSSVSVVSKISGKATLKAAFPDMNMFHFSVKPEQQGTLQVLQNDPDVEFVEPNYILEKVSEAQPGQVMNVLSED